MLEKNPRKAIDDRIEMEFSTRGFDDVKYTQRNKQHGEFQ